ncbi:MAG: hypothetical protein PHY47_06290 [Lachnospiraceae bacterium]|nr:hypothetical protein [Lachnospiraceae bacterium]
MKLKYYLRGLGIGIFVATLVLGIVLGKKEHLTDAEIKERAIQLGMVSENSVLVEHDSNTEEIKEISPNSTKQEKQIVSTNSISSNQKADALSQNNSNGLDTDKKLELPEIGNKEDEAEDGQASKDENKEKTDQTDNTVSIVIASGQSSVSVAKACKELGLIKDAAEFDRFLCSKGYDRRIVAGTHEITIGATEDEIGQAITKK